MPTWLLILSAVVIGALIWRVGMASIRSFSIDPEAEGAPEEPEDVEDLDVYLVCGECGTELKVSRLA